MRTSQRGNPLRQLLDTRRVPLDVTGLRAMSGPDWDELIELGARNRVNGLLYRRVNEPDLLGVIPDAALGRLTREHHAAVQAATRLRAQLPIALRAIAERGIRVVVLKGGHLAFHVYDDPALRPMVDVDLLARPEDLPSISSALDAIGYQPVDVTLMNDAPDYENYWHLPPFVRDGWMPLEVHRAMGRDPRSVVSLPTDRFWERARPARFGDAQALVLAPEDLLLHLCVHVGAQHRFQVGLRMVYDIPALIERYERELDWKMFVETSVVSDTQRYCYYALAVAEELLGARVPAEVLTALRPPNDAPDLVQVIAWYVLEHLRYQLPAGAQLVQRAAGLRGRTLAAVRALFPPADKLRRIYALEAGDRTVYWYYLRRPFDTLIRGGGLAIQLLSAESPARSALALGSAATRIDRALSAGM